MASCDIWSLAMATKDDPNQVWVACIFELVQWVRNKLTYIYIFHVR